MKPFLLGFLTQLLSKDTIVSKGHSTGLSYRNRKSRLELLLQVELVTAWDPPRCRRLTWFTKALSKVPGCLCCPHIVCLLMLQLSSPLCWPLQECPVGAGTSPVPQTPRCGISLEQPQLLRPSQPGVGRGCGGGALLVLAEG